jgi:hypothetical protein
VKVQKQQVGSGLVLTLAGPIDETVDFDREIGPLSGAVTINLRGISRLNSTGIKGWLKFFQSQSKSAQIVFQECSVAIIEQMNLISNFSIGAKVESIFAPFLCDKCQEELVALFNVTDLVAANFKMPQITCTKCQGNASFDDIEQEYFAFIKPEKL